MLRRPHADDDTTDMILIGVCGGIAAYKTCELVRMLVRGGHDVQVVQTPDAQRFVGPTTFAALSRRPVLTDGGAEVFPHLDASARGRADVHRAADGDDARPHRPRRGGHVLTATRSPSPARSSRRRR